MKDVQDVDFQELDDKWNDNLYYSTSQVADILGIAHSRVIYYCKVFHMVLDVERSNSHRRFSKDNIEKLIKIIDLKEKGLKLKQIEEVMTNNVEEVAVKITENNPIAMQVMAETIVKEQMTHLEDFKLNLLDSIDSLIEMKLETAFDRDDALKTEISSSISSIVDDRLDILEKNITENNADVKQDISDKIDKSLTENLSAVTKNLENVTEDIKEIKKTAYVTKDHLDEYKNRSWINRIFGK